MKKIKNYLKVILNAQYLHAVHFCCILSVALLFMFCLFIPQPVYAASFGYSDDGKNYIVNTGANLIFKVNHSNGDLTSLVYGETEYDGYQGKNSHVESGLGTSDVTISKPNASTIMITVVHGTLKHYYVARSGENNVYMFTNKADNSVNAGRYVVRLKPNILPNEGSDGWKSTWDTIEAGDIIKDPATGYTYSKHYSGERTIDYDYTGKTNGKVGIWLVRSNHEKASGGPFYRSLIKGSTELAQDLYEILHYSMAQVEDVRYGLQGPYILSFTNGEPPSNSLFSGNINTSWIDNLGIKGWVGSSERGSVSGVGITGRDSNYDYVVGFSNSDAQYWTKVDKDKGYFSCKNMLPGTYNMKIYKNELSVWMGNVTVTAGGVKTLNTISIKDDPSNTNSIWRIGDWDGTPLEFKNGNLMTYAHPSDSRAKSWTGNYTVGTSKASDFPCYQWKDVNNNIYISFKLNATQAASAHTLKIAYTANSIGGRVQPSINSWTASAPSAPSQPSSRSLTVGTYRENNSTYTVNVPASAFNTDTTKWNVLKLSIISGSTGTGYLSPGVSYDCIELDN